MHDIAKSVRRPMYLYYDSLSSDTFNTPAVVICTQCLLQLWAVVAHVVDLEETDVLEFVGIDHFHHDRVQLALHFVLEERTPVRNANHNRGNAFLPKSLHL